MNAILRQECEATVLTLEAIEVHLSYLRPAVEALSEKLDQANKDRAAGDAMLAEKIDRANEKIDQANKDRAAGDAMLAEKIDQANKDRAAGDATLAEKIDRANRDRAAGDAMLAEKIDELRKIVLRIDSRASAVVWVGGGLVALITLAITVGKAFHWF